MSQANGQAKADPARKPVIEYQSGWYNQIAEELRRLDQWVAWKFEWDKGKWTKAPYIATAPQYRASHSKPPHWRGFDKAVTAWLNRKDNGVDGVGFVLSPDDPYCGIDFDRCLGEGGSVLDWARPYISRLTPTYGDVSPSGRGVKFFIKGSIPGKGIKRNGLGPDGSGAVEIYDRTRFFTVTGNPFDAGNLGD